MDELTKTRLCAGILVKADIKKHNLIWLDDEKYKNEDCYSNASYDFRLDKSYYSVDHMDGCKKILHPHKKQCNDETIDCSTSNNIIHIEPFSSIVIRTYERVMLPYNIAGRFDMRISWALQGLFLQVGTQIEPGYNGYLFGLIYNFSNKRIDIPISERFLTAEFYYTTQESSPDSSNEIVNYQSIEDFVKKHPLIGGALNGYIRELQIKYKKSEKKIDKKVNELEQLSLSIVKTEKKLVETTRFRENVRYMLLTLVISLVVILPLSIGLPLIVGKFFIDKDDYPFEKVFTIEENNKKLKSQVEQLEKKVLLLENKMKDKR